MHKDFQVFYSKSAFFLISDWICGDKCLSENGNSLGCQCGSKKLEHAELQIQNMYCCSTTPCNSTNENVYCLDGNFKSFTEPCNMNCPIARRTSSIALSTENCPDKGQCFDVKDKHHFFNRVCIQTANLSGENFTKYCDDTNAEICNNNVTTKNEFTQFIVSGSTSL